MEEIAKVLYDAYVKQSGGLNYQGKPCPLWADLPEAIRENWRAVDREAQRIYPPNPEGE